MSGRKSGSKPWNSDFWLAELSKLSSDHALKSECWETTPSKEPEYISKDEPGSQQKEESIPAVDDIHVDWTLDDDDEHDQPAKAPQLVYIDSDIQPSSSSSWKPAQAPMVPIPVRNAKPVAEPIVDETPALLSPIPSPVPPPPVKESPTISMKSPPASQSASVQETSASQSVNSSPVSHSGSIKTWAKDWSAVPEWHPAPVHIVPEWTAPQALLWQLSSPKEEETTDKLWQAPQSNGPISIKRPTESPTKPVAIKSPTAATEKLWEPPAPTNSVSIKSPEKVAAEPTAVANEPAPTEATVKLWEPPAAKKPISIKSPEAEKSVPVKPPTEATTALWEPVAAKAPVTIESPKDEEEKKREPPVAQKPISIQSPTKEPVTIEPSNVENPTPVKSPSEATEKLWEPTAPKEPITIQSPISEPATSRSPAEATEKLWEPAATKAPISIRSPVVEEEKLWEPAAPKEPVTIQSPVSEPATSRSPAEATEKLWEPAATKEPISIRSPVVEEEKLWEPVAPKEPVTIQSPISEPATPDSPVAKDSIPVKSPRETPARLWEPAAAKAPVSIESSTEQLWQPPAAVSAKSPAEQQWQAAKEPVMIQPSEEIWQPAAKSKRIEIKPASPIDSKLMDTPSPEEPESSVQSIATLVDPPPNERAEEPNGRISWTTVDEYNDESGSEYETDSDVSVEQITINLASLMRSTIKRDEKRNDVPVIHCSLKDLILGVKSQRICDIIAEFKGETKPSDEASVSELDGCHTVNGSVSSAERAFVDKGSSSVKDTLSVKDEDVSADENRDAQTTDATPETLHTNGSPQPQETKAEPGMTQKLNAFAPSFTPKLAAPQPNDTEEDEKFVYEPSSYDAEVNYTDDSAALYQSSSLFSPPTYFDSSDEPGYDHGSYYPHYSYSPQNAYVHTSTAHSTSGYSP